MAQHATSAKFFKGLLEEYGIENGQNVEKLVEMEDETVVSRNQQHVLENCMHLCDVSNAARDFSVAKNWTYLLFDEFFDQGDLERESNLPISFLCDRNTNIVPQT